MARRIASECRRAWTGAVRLGFVLPLLLLFFMLGLILVRRSVFASFTDIYVNTLADDSTPGDGSCSLRKAIINANNPGSDPSDGDCVEAAGIQSQIFFNGTGSPPDGPVVSGTITLSSALPKIENVLYIDGTGESITINGNSHQIFFVDSPGNLSLNDLTITDGGSNSLEAGGAIYNAGILNSITNCTFSNNTAADYGGAIYTNGSTGIVATTFAGNSTTNPGVGAGGAIFIDSLGGLDLSESTFSLNTSVYGGGAIQNNGGLGITNSTFADNSTTSVGGGAIYNSSVARSLSITNSTFSANTAPSGDGGAINNEVSSTPPASITNSILAGSMSANNCAGSVALKDGGYNISSDNSCGFTATGSQNNLSPQLDPKGLDTNGAPTETIALEATSPAIDAIPLANCPAVDQRRFGRPGFPTATACDIGAFEYTPIVVDTTDDPGITSDYGFCTLREAIDNANEPGTDTTDGDCTVGADIETIIFGVSGTITLGSNGSLPQILNTLTIDGTGQSITIDGAGAYQVLSVNPTAIVTLNDLTIAHGNSASANGAGVSNAGTLTVTNSTFWDNVAGGTFKGGGIFSAGISAAITNSTFSGNSAFTGGGIFNSAGNTLTVINSTLSGNTAGHAASGGGIYNNGGSATITNSVLANNTHDDCDGSAISGGSPTYDIDDDGTCNFGNNPGANGQTIGDSINPLLDPTGLQDSGGPTDTIALQFTSPAIAAIPQADCPATDQRGYVRPAIGQTACDIGAVEGVSAPWPMFHHDLKHTGLSPYDTSSNTGNLKWNFTTGEAVASSPTVGPDGSIYVGSNDQNLYAFNPDGTLKWHYSMGGGVSSSPAVGSGGTIYVGSEDDNLYAINPDGTLKWKYTTGGPIFDSSPAIGPDGTIYVGSEDDNLYAINPDGTEKWAFPTGDFVDSSPAIGVDGTIYVGSEDDNLYAINPDGTENWAFLTGNFVDSSPAIGADGTIYVGSGYPHARLYAVTPRGARRWAFASGAGASFSPPAIGADGTVYAGCYDGSLHAIDSDGKKKWALAIGVVGNSAPAIGADGTIYVASDDFSLHAIKPEGVEKWSFAIGNDLHSAAAIGADGTVYVGSGDNSLYAVGSAAAPQPPH